MNLHNHYLQKSFQSKSVLKIITGINNINVNKVLKIAKAAELSKATYLDVAANVNLVKTLKVLCRLPICISSINPVDMYNCVIAGADLVEIGNYDFFCNKGIYLTVKQIINLSIEVKYLIRDIDICVTIPHYISLAEQVYLAQQLEFIGVNVIQTEGFSKCYEREYINSNTSILNSSNSFIPSLLSTYFISKSVKIPVIAASGCNNIFASLANVYGAHGVGFGSSLQKQNNINSIIKYINQAHKSLNSSMNSESLICLDKSIYPILRNKEINILYN
uniref:Uncharacterized protein ycf23 n=1 Tax=Polysiphonia infestans TaxID=2006978 RepID=A0A1Z1ME21_9FLOR|nr:hypothetical protein [Polysiphonia infestans]ARW64318.1 hypothetical protein [Polysiphonia infestans]